MKQITHIGEIPFKHTDSDLCFPENIPDERIPTPIDPITVTTIEEPEPDPVLVAKVEDLKRQIEELNV